MKAPLGVKVIGFWKISTLDTDDMEIFIYSGILPDRVIKYYMSYNLKP